MKARRWSSARALGRYSPIQVYVGEADAETWARAQVRVDRARRDGDARYSMSRFITEAVEEKLARQ